VLLSERNRGFHQLSRESLVAKVLADEEAWHAPDGLIVDRREHLRTFQARVVRARTDCDPADHFFAGVREQSRRNVAVHNLPECPLRSGTFLLEEFLVLPAPGHAPASAARTVVAEKSFEVLPAFGRERLEDELHGSTSLRRSTGS